MDKLLLPAFAGMMLLGLSAAADPADYMTVDPAEVELRVDLIDPAPLPLQPARLRLTLRNTSRRRIGPIAPVDDLVGALVKRPQDRFGRLKAIVDTFRGSTAPSARDRNNRLKDARLYLEPGEQTSVSFVLALLRDEQESKVPVFDELGLYRIKCQYQKLEKEIQIEIREPRGDDRSVYEVLRKNGPLATVMLSGLDVPEPALVPKLKALLELFPDSSYTSYVRFALARSYLRGNGIDETSFEKASTRVDRALAIDLLIPVFTNRTPSALFPNILIATRAADPRFYEVNRVALELWYKHPDALEWLEVVAGRLTPEEWPQYRKGKFGVSEKLPLEEFLRRMQPAQSR